MVVPCLCPAKGNKNSVSIFGILVGVEFEKKIERPIRNVSGPTGTFSHVVRTERTPDSVNLRSVVSKCSRVRHEWWSVSRLVCSNVIM